MKRNLFLILYTIFLFIFLISSQCSSDDIASIVANPNINNSSEEIYYYSVPDNLTEVIQLIRTEIIQQGGIFSGNEQSGSFSYHEIQGEYFINEDHFVVIIRSIDLDFMRDSSSPRPRFSFSFSKPANITLAVENVRNGIEASGGYFSGDEQFGNFNAGGIAGQYNVTELVNVNIHEKPLFIPNSMIEREIKNYFNVR